MPRHNGPLLPIADIIKFVMSSATKSELSAMLIAVKKMVPLCQTLIKTCWPQPHYTLQTENSAADGVNNYTIVPR